MSPALAVVPQSCAKNHFYFTFYYIILNSNCDAQRVSENMTKWQTRVLKAKTDA
jgi:hypothetical protein